MPDRGAYSALFFDATTTHPRPIISLLLGTVVLLFLGVILKSLFFPKQATNIYSQSVQEKILEATPTILQAPLWITYTNKAYNYTIQYPSNRLINCIIAGQENDLSLYEGRQCLAGSGSTVFAITPQKARVTLTSACTDMEKEVIEIAQRKATKYTTVATKNPGCKASGYQQNSTLIELSHNKTPLQIFIAPHMDKAITKKMLDSFAFTK